MKFLSLTLLASVLASAGCSEAPAPAAPIAVVRVISAGQLPTVATRTYSGEVRARRETAPAFRVGGKIVERLVDVGALVKPGQALARLDPTDLALAAAQAEAQRALAQAEAQRYRDLRTKNFISQSALDARETAAQTAAAQAELARNQASYAVLSADKAGAVAQVLAEPGQVVAAGQAVFRLAESGEMEVSIAIPEGHMEGLKPGASAEVSLWTGKGPLHGKLRELSPVADPATRTYAARVSLVDANPSAVLGMTAAVRFTRDSGSALIVPHAAIFQQGSQQAVWVLNPDDTLALRAVSVSVYGDAGATIVNGLKPGETIVAVGVHKLIAGQRVRPQQ